MQKDTWISLGTTIAMAALMVSIMVALFASTNARIDRLDVRIDGLRDDFTTQFGRLDSRIDGLRDDVNVQIGSLRDDVNMQNGSLRADMREDHAAIHARLDSLQDGLADVGQRLARVEGRVGIARADDADTGPRSEP